MPYIGLSEIIAHDGKQEVAYTGHIHLEPLLLKVIGYITDTFQFHSHLESFFQRSLSERQKNIDAPPPFLTPPPAINNYWFLI